jgi:hypothetical protein
MITSKENRFILSDGISNLSFTKNATIPRIINASAIINLKIKSVLMGIFIK